MTGDAWQDGQTISERVVNKIVRKHFPAEKLPPELREGMADGATVEIVVTEEARPKYSVDELLRMAAAYPKDRSDPHEAARRIRELRDEWDD